MVRLYTHSLVTREDVRLQNIQEPVYTVVGEPGSEVNAVTIEIEGSCKEEVLYKAMVSIAGALVAAQEDKPDGSYSPDLAKVLVQDTLKLGAELNA